VDESLSTGLLRDGEPVDRILAAAELCFRQGGYHAASVRQIAEAAGVSKSLLHYHFQSKEHLLLEMLVRVYGRLAERVTESLNEERGPAERGLFALDALLASLRESPYFQAQAEVWASSLTDARLCEHARRVREHLRSELIRTLATILGPAAERMPIPLAAAADLLWATVSGLGLSASMDEPARVEEAFRAFRLLVSLALAEGARGNT
jgi:AcrR family transcriptional regulator